MWVFVCLGFICEFDRYRLIDEIDEFIGRRHEDLLGMENDVLKKIEWFL
jgi:hypothetical protein